MANILLVLSVYTLLWIVGDIASRLLRTHQFVNGKLRLVRGLRLESVISLAEITGIYLSGDPAAPEPEALLDVLLERAAADCAALTSATRPVRF